jgi:adenylosuccinate lyase
MSTLAGIASSLHKFALDFRLLQSPLLGEWMERFDPGQVGSSAMPHKRNPIVAENICSLARYVAALPAVAWDNASQAILERSLDDSANRRLMLPEAFLAVDELLRKATSLVEGMTWNAGQIARHMAEYGPFAATERLLVALVAAGADRQEAHGWIRQSAAAAWAAVATGQENPLADLVAGDERILAYLPAGQARQMTAAADDYTGSAAERAAAFAAQLRQKLD